MITFLTAQKRHRHCLRRGPVDERPLEACLGFVCGRDIAAREDSPFFDKASMDGFAVRLKDIRYPETLLAVSASVFAGETPRALKPGTCCKIATGAAVPRGADAVVKKEDTRYSQGDRVVILKKAARGENILFRASHFKKGDRIFFRNDRVGAAGIALAASQGMCSLPVYAPPVVALLSTGDEVQNTGGRRKRFGVWNATGPMLKAALEKAGASVVCLGTSRDSEKDLFRLIRRGLKADMLVVTGAVSVGDRDLVPRLLKKAGVKLVFHRVLMKPGKPVLFGARGRTLVYGLPGNPVSTLATYSVFVKPAIEHWLGRSGGLIIETGFLKNKFSMTADRLTFFPARLYCQKDRWEVSPLGYHDSADTRAAARADCFFVYGSNVKNLKKGSPVAFLRMDP